jgi:hypothetical protein
MLCAALVISLSGKGEVALLTHRDSKSNNLPGGMLLFSEHKECQAKGMA